MYLNCNKSLQTLRNARISIPKSRLVSTTHSTRNEATEDNISKNTRVPSDADVVVIGGGSLGCNTLYHLSKLGITNTVLLEAHQLTAGTTWHTAGLLWRLRPNDTEIQLINSTRNLLLNLENETGINPGWINNGGLFIASNKARLDEYKRLMTIGKIQNIESFVLDPQETKKLYPLMNVDDVYGTLYSPGDGTIDPAGFCDALTRAAKKVGAKVFEKCSVLDIQTEPSFLGGKQVTQIETTLGPIKTKCVVNATGAWANDITKMVGVNIPLVPMKHAYVITEKIDGIQNMPNVRDHDASVYLRLQGDALSVGGYESDPIILDKLDKNFAFGLYDLDWNVFSTHIEGAVKRIPVLERTGIKSTVCGPESFTPDHKPIMGEDPEVSGFYHCCGFNSAGMMMGGGCGEQMAKWVAKGRPDFDMFGYDIRRFRPSLNSDKNWIVSRSHESYVKNYAIVFPHDDPLAGRNMNKSPIHDILERVGCVFQERHGYERPGWFNTVPSPTQEYEWYGAYGNSLSKDCRYKVALSGDYSFDFPPFHELIKRECMATRFSSALFDMSYFGKFYLSGTDAQKAADWIFSANMQKDPGSVVYTCMLNERGGAEADLTVSIIDEEGRLSSEPQFKGRGFYLAAGGAAALQNWAHVIQEIRKNNWDVELKNCSDTMAMLSLQGPYSRNILKAVSNADFSNEAFPFSKQKIIQIAGVKARALRLSFVGEMGWELHIPAEDTVKVYQALLEAGRKYQLVNAGYRAIDSLSAEKGYVHWHADLRSDDSPLEAGLGFSCKLKSSTPFLGRAALEKLKENGLRRKLVTFTLNDPTTPIWGLEGIYRDNKSVGFLRRADYAFYLGKSIGYGYVSKDDGGKINKEFLSTGCWEIESKGERHQVEVHLKPPFDPKNKRIMGIYPETNQNVGNVVGAIA